MKMLTILIITEDGDDKCRKPNDEEDERKDRRT